MRGNTWLIRHSFRQSIRLAPDVALSLCCVPFGAVKLFSKLIGSLPRRGRSSGEAALFSWPEGDERQARCGVVEGIWKGHEILGRVHLIRIAAARTNRALSCSSVRAPSPESSSASGRRRPCRRGCAEPRGRRHDTCRAPMRPGAAREMSCTETEAHASQPRAGRQMSGIDRLRIFTLPHEIPTGRADEGQAGCTDMVSGN